MSPQPKYLNQLTSGMPDMAESKAKKPKSYSGF